jgi:hypothetical protein
MRGVKITSTLLPTIHFPPLYTPDRKRAAMPDQDRGRKPPDKGRATKTLAEKVRPIQERAGQMGFVSDGLDDKAFMDEAWGEDDQDAEQRNLEAVRAVIKAGLDSGSGIPADQVFAGLHARYAKRI